MVIHLKKYLQIQTLSVATLMIRIRLEKYLTLALRRVMKMTIYLKTNGKQHRYSLEQLLA